jgi:hypothetical protein
VHEALALVCEALALVGIRLKRWTQVKVKASGQNIGDGEDD